MFGKQRIATLVAEFLGTGVLTLLILTVQRSTIGVPFFVAMAAGLTLASMVFSLGRFSGGYFNPAVTFGLWTARRLETITAALYVVVQLLGAWGAYALYTYFVNTSLQPSAGHFTGRILVAEAVGAGLFSFGVAAAIYQGLNRVVTASYAGVALMLGMLVASTAAIGLLNPAVALGIRAWIPFGQDVAGWGTYVLGPFLGSIVGVNLYALLFAEGQPSIVSAVKAPVAKTKKPVAKKKTANRKK